MKPCVRAGAARAGAVRASAAASAAVSGHKQSPREVPGGFCFGTSKLKHTTKYIQLFLSTQAGCP